MKISTKGLYAVRLMLYLAEHDGAGPVSLKEVSDSLGISKKKYLEIVSNGYGEAGAIPFAARLAGISWPSRQASSPCLMCCE